MAYDKRRDPDVLATRAPGSPDDHSSDVGGETQAVQHIHYDDSRKIGITGAVFLILNKMIGTGSTSAHTVPSLTRMARLTRTCVF